MTDPEFDARFRDLGPVEPPSRVADRTVAAWRGERRSAAWRTRTFAVAGMAAMAALSLLVVQDPDRPSDPGQLVERGAGEQSPTVELKVAVTLADGQIERFAANRRYDAGDTLMFRIRTTTSTTLTLRRDGVVVWSGAVPVGESDLPVGYRLEAGESAAIFSIEGGAETLRFPVPAVSP